MTQVAHIQPTTTCGNPQPSGNVHHSKTLRCSMFLVQCSVFNRPYLVFNEQGYSKHYYAGAERVSSRIGGGMQDALVDPLNYTVEILSGQDYTVMAGDLQDMLGRNIECTDMPLQYVSMEQQLVSIEESKNHNNTEDNRYIYHSDHLGSSAFLTDIDGNPTQHLQYLPFGEPFIEQRSVTEYYTPYTFSAKERDLETGYSYFGARYYNSQISVWLSVDPMADERPSLSPYNYCQWNPIIRTDPAGMLDDWVSIDGQMKWDDRVTNQASAEAHYGKNAKHRASGYEYTTKEGDKVVLGDDRNFSLNGVAKIAKDFTPVRQSKFVSHTVDQNYRPNGYNYGSLQDFVDYYSGWDIDDIRENVTSGVGSGIHFVKDPITGKYIDMKHFLVAGQYGNGAGLVKEFLQLWSCPGSAFDKQDLFSNDLGSMFYGKYSFALKFRKTDGADFIYEFLTSKENRNRFILKY